MRATLQDALDSRIPPSINIISTDPRAIQYINAATQRLLPRGLWFGTTPKYTVSVTEQLFSLPPFFDTLEMVAVCRTPIDLRNQWYEFNSNGIGVVNDPSSVNGVSCGSCPGNACIFRGRFPTFKDIVSGNRVRFQCDVSDDIGTEATIYGYDSNGNWVRTKPAADWQDGETISATQSPGTTSTTIWGKITDVKLQTSDGQKWLYQWDGSTATLIANYQYWETNPNYARYLLPLIFNSQQSAQVDVIGKLGFRPVVNPTDYLIIGNLEALRLACMAIKLEEEHMWTEAAIAMNGKTDANNRVVQDGAITILKQELDHFQGGEVPSIHVIGSTSPTGEIVEALL